MSEPACGRQAVIYEINLINNDLENNKTNENKK